MTLTWRHLDFGNNALESGSGCGVQVPVKNSGDPLTGTLEETSTNKQTKQKAAAGGKLCLLWVQNHDIIMYLSQVCSHKH